MRDRLSRWLLSVLLVIAICAESPLVAQSAPNRSEEPQGPSYRSSVSEVRLVFFPADEHNHSVEGLQKDDFAVVDDERVIRDFRSFSRSESIKLDVVVLIDSSESALPQFEQEIRDVEQLISQWPWGPEDSLSVLSFSGMETHLVCAGDCRSSSTAKRLALVPRGGSTPLFDAVEIATDILTHGRQPDAQPVIVLFSDGEDTISKASLRGTLQEILASEAQIYAIDTNRPGWPSNGTATLQTLANDSGGRRVAISEGATSIFKDIFDDVHSARVVTYAPPDSSSDFHSIRILPTHNLKLQFRCRRGYYRQVVSAQSEDRP